MSFCRNEEKRQKQLYVRIGQTEKIVRFIETLTTARINYLYVICITGNNSALWTTLLFVIGILQKYLLFFILDIFVRVLRYAVIMFKLHYAYTVYYKQVPL